MVFDFGGTRHRNFYLRALQLSAAAARRTRTSANQPLDVIAETSREMISSMSDIVWAINPDKDHFSDPVQRMRRFASVVLEAQDIAYSQTSYANMW